MRQKRWLTKQGEHDTIIKPLKKAAPEEAFIQAGQRVNVVIMLTTTNADN